jgi:hypothetical protein
MWYTHPGLPRSQWMLPSGEYLHRIATTAVMVIHVSETQKKGKKK